MVKYRQTHVLQHPIRVLFQHSYAVLNDTDSYVMLTIIDALDPNRGINDFTPKTNCDASKRVILLISESYSCQFSKKFSRR